jgi:hypothetical protein
LSQFRPFSNYMLRAHTTRDCCKTFIAESEDGSHSVEFKLTQDQFYQLMSKEKATSRGRVNGTLSDE